jgi:predicted AlkP superfamily pyrophosphatase or phosphodiesterase
MMYFEEPDTIAHTFGPESAQVLSYIQKVGILVLEITFSTPSDLINISPILDYSVIVPCK